MARFLAVLSGCSRRFMGAELVLEKIDCYPGVKVREVSNMQGRRPGRQGCRIAMYFCFSITLDDVQRFLPIFIDFYISRVSSGALRRLGQQGALSIRFVRLQALRRLTRIADCSSAVLSWCTYSPRRGDWRFFGALQVSSAEPAPGCYLKGVTVCCQAPGRDTGSATEMLRGRCCTVCCRHSQRRESPCEQHTGCY